MGSVKLNTWRKGANNVWRRLNSVPPVVTPPVEPVEPPPSSATSFWSPASPINAPIVANPVLDPNSSSIAGVLTTSNPGLSIVAYGTTIYRATAQTPRHATGAVGSGAGLEIVNTPEWGPNPLAGLTVPIDPSWVGAPGYVQESWKDAAAVIIDTNGRVFGLWQFEPAAGGRPHRVSFAGWSWAGPTENVITDVSGNSVGAGFSRLAGILRRDEIESGEPIKHALVFASKHVRPSTVLAPAKKTDGAYTVGNGQGATLLNSIPEAQRIQLNPAYNVDATSATPLVKRIAKAVQEYGAYCVDNGGGAPFQLICETPPLRSQFSDNGSYTITIKDPVYTAAGITADGPRLNGIAWAGNLRVLKNWNGA